MNFIIIIEVNLDRKYQNSQLSAANLHIEQYQTLLFGKPDDPISKALECNLEESDALPFPFLSHDQAKAF